MPWNHLSDLKYWKSLASDAYSVNSIPDNLLVDPEGTVVARGLRGEALEARLAEVFESAEKLYTNVCIFRNHSLSLQAEW